MSAAVPCQGIGLLYGTAGTHRQHQRRGRTDLFRWRLPLVRSVSESIYFLPCTVPPEPYFWWIFAGTTIAGIQSPVTFGEYIINIFFTVHGAPIHQPASARSPHQPRESFVLPLWHRSRCRREQCGHHARGRAVCHPRLRSGCRSVDHWSGRIFRAVDNQDVAHFNLKVRRLPTIVRHRAVRWN